MRTHLMVLTAATLAGAALAQPPSFTDLGNRTATQTFTQPVTLAAANDIQWFRLELPAVTASAGWFDVWTTPTANPLASTDLTNTEIGLYNSAGARAVVSLNFSDDNDGPGAYSQLSFGSTTARPATTFGSLTPGLPRAGGDGVFAAGVYYLAVGSADVTFGFSAFNVTSTYADTRRTTLLTFDIRNGSDPFPPSAVGMASLGTANAGDTLVYMVTVTPGGNPVSTGITVTGNLSPVGGPAGAVFHDDGLNGDAFAGDNVFSYQYTIPADTDDNTYTLNVSVLDAQGRAGSAQITANVTGPVTWDELTTGDGDAGQTIATAQSPVGTSELRVITGDFAPNDVDIYKINVCSIGQFSVSTHLSNPTIDTQLFLFDGDGRGVVMNDDVPVGFPGSGSHASRVTGAFLTETGNYYLAVCRWDVDPASSTGDIWADTPVNTQRTPDGPGAAGALASWSGTSDPGVYRLSMRGVCFPISECGAADMGGTGGIPGADGVLDNNDFVVFINYFFNQVLAADVGSTGGVHGGDLQFDNNDFVVFIDLFFSGGGCH